MPLITLDTTTAKLQVLLGGAVGANECPMTATVADERKDAIGGRADTTVQRTFDGISTGATAVDLVPVAPSNVRRKITSFTLHNADTSSVTVTVRLYVNASTTRILFKGTLATVENLYYDDERGWYVLASSGEQRTTPGTESSNAQSSATSAGLADSVTRSNATSGGLGDSVTRSGATSAGLADSVTRSGTTSAGLAASTALSTAAS